LAQYFFDTSAIVKYYHREAGSPAVESIFAQADRKVRISSLGFLEIQSAFAMKVRSRELSRDAAGIQRSRLLLDVAAGEIEIYKMTDLHFGTAQRLIGDHAFVSRLRTLDALQLAMAIDLTEQLLLDFFVVADAALSAVAVTVGLKVINP